MIVRTLVLSLLVLSACTKKEEKASLPDKPVVTAASAQAEAPATAAPSEMTGEPAAAPTAAAPAAATPAPGQAMTVETRLSGEVSSQRKASLAFRVTGFIQEIKSKPGDPCKKGQVLATLDDRDYRLAQDVARSKRDVARVALVNAKSEFDREEELRRQNVSTEAMYDKLKAAFDKARLDLQLAELELKKSEQAMADTKLLAPYDCVIAKQMKFVGENLQSGNAVFEVYDTTDAELSFAVPERLAGKIKVGDTLKVTIASTGFTGSVPIIRLVPVVEGSSRTFRVIAQAPSDPRIVPGLYAEAILN